MNKVNPSNKICFNLAKCINNAKSQPCKRLSKINNVNVYQNLASQKGKKVSKIKLNLKTFKLSKWNNILILN
jgi:hypothetical protein